MNYERLSIFVRELKALTKRYPSLPNDIKIAEQVIGTLYSTQNNYDTATIRKNFFNSKRAAVITKSDSFEAVKMRLDCASLGNKNSMRVVFVFVKNNEEVTFIELFSKSDKDREDSERLQQFIQAQSSATD